jgi:hypothetical protein
MFVIYGGAGLFAWAAFKTVVFNEVPPMVKHLVSFFR